MEGSIRSPIVLLLILAVVLAAGSLGAVAQLDPPAGQRYMLIAVKGRGESRARLAFRIGGHVALPGFANKSNHWFAVTGSESLVPPGYSYGGGDDVPKVGQGLGALLRLLVNNGTR
ncbi:hypothetical protein HU200_065313 [Digitaria exilis]|uniref:rRNA N-glycosidase n=1 Tax=Digitaria exilis TaxID=1010633 RepID=A0A835DTV4_9POAL|nr:hypothetical protein HU200_065313 [Digitaria exilis]